MKDRTLQFKGQSSAQMLKINAELLLMSNNWRRVGVQMTINKEHTLQFTGQSSNQMQTIDAELRLMSNNWRKVGVRMTIDDTEGPEQQLREAPSRKRQASSFKRQGTRIWS